MTISLLHQTELFRPYLILTITGIRLRLCSCCIGPTRTRRDWSSFRPITLQRVVI